MASDLERAFTALDRKRKPYSDLWAYYEGDQPVVYTVKRLQEIFRDVDARFTENWCAVVVDSAQERTRLSGFTVAGNVRAQEILDEAWAAGELALEADDAHLAAYVCGEAFVLVWPDADGAVQCYYNDPRLCHVFYDAENPRQPTFAAKWWDDDAPEGRRRRVTLYYPDHLEHYVSRGTADNLTSAAGLESTEDGEVPNPFGQVPVFHFRTGRRAVSEIKNAIPLQNGINKLLIDMMVAAEYGAFRQRWVISDVDALGKLKNAPNEIWRIPAGDGITQGAQVGEFNPTDLGNYLTGIDKLATAIGIITRTPRHYFYAQGGDPSGEALIAMEAPLNKKVQRRIERFTSTWRSLAVFLLALAGEVVDPAGVKPMYDEPATVQPRTEAETRKFSVDAGIPLKTALRREGWSEAELEQMDEDKREEADATKATLAAALVDAQRRFDQGQGQGAPEVQPDQSGPAPVAGSQVPGVAGAPAAGG